jgi:hypothetical protein
MSVTVRNAVVQNQGRTLASAHFVAAQGLSRADQIATLSALVNDAAVTLGLPVQGPEAAEILYQLADERAGAGQVEFEAAAPAADLSTTWRGRMWGRFGPAVVFTAMILALALLYWVERLRG